MSPLSFGCGIVTEQLSECKDFYCLLFGFKVASESEWYVQLVSEDGKQQIGFLSPSQLSQPRILHHPYEGRGCWVNIEVENVDEAFDRLVKFSVPIELEPRTESWGERHLIVRDPAQMAVNVMQKLTKASSGDLP